MQSFSTTQRRLAELRDGAVAVVTSTAIFDIAGSGAVACLQGLLSADLVKPGTASLTYGAILTPKGMIVVDFHSIRLDDRFLLVADPLGREPATALFQRQLPPRLAKVTDRTDAAAVLWLHGSASTAMLTAALGAVPAPGGTGVKTFEATEIAVGSTVPDQASFRHLVVGDHPAVAALAARLAGFGAFPGGDADLRAARVRAGTPTLGAEIDEKTLPQEAGFERLRGVAFDKGCYVGQETVARLHFRGHANWVLRGFELEGTPPAVVEREGKPVAKIGTAVTLESGKTIGLAKVRREIEPETSIPIGDAARLRVVELPFPD